MTEEVEKPSLQDTVRAAMAEHSADPPDIPSEPASPASETASPPETVSQAEGARARPPAISSTKPNAAVTPAAEPTTPPAWWKGAGKIDWKRLPTSIQGELGDYVGRLEAERSEVAPLKEMIDQSRDVLVREAGSVAEGFRQLLAFHRLSLEKPLDLIHHIARTRGIDLRAAFAGQPQAQQPGSPQTAPDLNRLVAQAVQQHLAPIQQQEQQRQYQNNLQTVQSFAADPAHPYFNDVADQMEALLKAGVAKDLSDAYDKATRLDPVISGQLDQERQKAAEDQRKADAEKARRAAAASVRGSPVPDAQRGNGGGPKSVRDAVRDAFSEHAA
jgi:hypothetical protein